MNDAFLPSPPLALAVARIAARRTGTAAPEKRRSGAFAASTVGS